MDIVETIEIEDLISKIFFCINHEDPAKETNTLRKLLVAHDKALIQRILRMCKEVRLEEIIIAKEGLVFSGDTHLHGSSVAARIEGRVRDLLPEEPT